MRNISPTSLAKIRQKLGTEPVNFITVQWAEGGQLHYYSDKKYPTDNPAIVFEGRILEIAGLESVLKLTKGAKTSSVSIRLDDTLGDLKNIINSNDIHKRPVTIWQWFTGIPISEAFIVFEGEIWSPITWREGDRTFSFEVAEMIEDREVGFSLEEGQVDFLSEDLVNKPMPLGFGTNISVPATRINETPVGTTLHPIAFPDGSLAQKMAQNSMKIKNLMAQQYVDLIYAGECAFAVFALTQTINDLSSALSAPDPGELAKLLNQTTNEITDYQTSVPAQLPDQYTDTPAAGSYEKPLPIVVQAPSINDVTDNTGVMDKQAIQTLIGKLTAQAQKLKSTQKAYEKKAAQEGRLIGQIKKDNADLATQLALQQGPGVVTSVINGQYFPRGEIVVKMGPVIMVGSFGGDSGNVFFPTIAVLPTENSGVQPGSDGQPPFAQPDINTKISKGKFTVVNPGAKVILLSFYPIHYIANILPSVVWNVQAYRSVGGGAKVLTGVQKFGSAPVLFNIDGTPNYSFDQYVRYYSVDYFPVINYTDSTILYNLTMITVPQALSTYEEGWEDELFVTFTSPVGPNTVDILIWLIETYSGHDWDRVSFWFVRETINQFPSHFTIIKRINIQQMLEEIAFQARLALWLSNGIFYLKYLAREEDPVEVITTDDIEFNTMELTHTRTEDLITKLVATYKFHYRDKIPSEIVLRYNINKYNVLERQIDFYIYSYSDAVYLSATFWIIRYGNTWKKLKFKTFLNKLNIETFDTVLLNFESILGGDIVVAGGQIKAVVESAKYDSTTNTIDMEVWIPVRAGEMTYYPFFWTAGINPFFYFPTNEEILDGRVGNPPNVNALVPNIGVQVEVNYGSYDLPGNYQSLGRPRDWGAPNLSDDRLTQVILGGDNQFGTARTTPDPYMVLLTRNTDAARLAQENPPPAYLGIAGEEEPHAVDGWTDVSAPVGGAGAAPEFTAETEAVLETPMSGPTEDAYAFPIEEDTLGDGVSNAQPYVYKDYPDPLLSVPPEPEVPAPETSGGGGVPVQIISGSGSNYQGYAYPNGPNKSPSPSHQISINVLQIDPNEKIPKGTWELATVIGGKYYIQPPIWLNDGNS